MSSNEDGSIEIEFPTPCPECLLNTLAEVNPQAFQGARVMVAMMTLDGLRKRGKNAEQLVASKEYIEEELQPVHGRYGSLIEDCVASQLAGRCIVFRTLANRLNV